MPKKFIQRYLPKPEKLREYKSLEFIADHIADPRMWSLTRSSVAGAFSIGLFVAFTPMPMQMLLAAALAGWFRVNLPLSVALVWVTNPLTMPPIYYACYLFGSWLMGAPAASEPSNGFTDWVFAHFNQIWPPLLLGCLVIGTTLSIVSNIAIRLIWRWQVSINWKKRIAQRRLALTQQNLDASTAEDPSNDADSKPVASDSSTTANLTTKNSP